MSISRCGQINPTSPTFLNIYLTKTVRNLLVVSKINEKRLQYSYKSFSYLTSLSRRGSINPSTPNFSNISLTETTTNLIAAWKFTKKWLHKSLSAP